MFYSLLNILDFSYILCMKIIFDFFAKHGFLRIKSYYEVHNDVT